jgi:ABC-type glycerol-3-phosphate transport system substrate-binding protein
MKKVFAILLALTVLLSLAACGGAAETPTESPAKSSAESSTQSPAEEVKGPDNVDLKELAANYNGEIHIEIWGKDSVGKDESSRGYLISKIAEEFSAMYDNVSIEYIYQGSYDEVAEKIMAAAAANDLPTMFLTEELMVRGFESIAADLRKYIPSTTIEDYQQGLLASMIGQNGELLGAPFARSLPVLYVNKELLEKAGWNGADIKTNEDMFQCARDVKEATGAYGLGYRCLALGICNLC